ncbi:MAG: hypothetical protein LBT33_09145, partial [Spirochaetia bacterium]|nr:hypothetical protein [Spirochaetia bacterium]
RAKIACNHGNCVVLRGFALLRQPGKSRKTINRDCDCRQSPCIQAGCCLAGERCGLSRDFSRNFRGNFCQGKNCPQAARYNFPLAFPADL